MQIQAGEPPEADYLVRARALVERAIRARWTDGLITRTEDGLLTSYLGSKEIERLLAPAGPGEAGTLADFAYDPEKPIGILIERLALQPSEADLLAVLLACEGDPVTARLVTYLSGNQTQFTPTIDLLIDIVYLARCARRSEAAAMVHRDLAGQRPLRRLGCLALDGADKQVGLARAVRLNPRMASWLYGDGELDPALSAWTRLWPCRPPVGECDPALEVEVAGALDHRRLVLIDGPPRSGRELLVRFAAVRIGRPLLVVNGRGLGAERVVAAFREAMLQGAMLAFRDGDELLGEAGVLERFRECLEVFDGGVAIVGAGRAAPQLTGLRPTTTVATRVPPFGDRLRLWGSYLGEGALPDEDLEQVAALYNLGIDGIVTASAMAREQAAFAGAPLARAHVAQAVSQLFDTDLSTVANRVMVSQRWTDVVLPEDVGESVADIIDRIRFRSQVLGHWGFERKLSRGLGLLALFSGEPGTGKTMVASLIAAELGLDLYAINLSRLMSKWIGETEKNLARAFDAAETGHVLLLFDEADTILGRRSAEMRNANDRYANLETNYILSRLEQFQGVAFFTTNLPSAIDPAVSRRMSIHVHFPFPDEQARGELWERMIPDEAPRDADIDFAELGRRYELSGGFIRNIVLRAAFLAAREKKPIGMPHLERAAEMEYRERGLLVAGGRMR